jgi:hypothetical protein
MFQMRDTHPIDMNPPMGTPRYGAPIFVRIDARQKSQILRSAYPRDQVRGTPSHPKDEDLPLGTPP